MGVITERLAELARRCGDLSPIATPVRDILVAGNRERALAGVDVNGVPFAPLKPSTLKKRRGSGPPQAPDGAGSEIVTKYEVAVFAGPGRLSISAAWPGVAWIEYARTGTGRMARRDPTGFREKDRDAIRGLMAEHVKGRG